MKIVAQRRKNSSVSVDNKIVGKINKGLSVYQTGSLKGKKFHGC